MTPSAKALPAWVDKVRDLLTKNMKENKDLISYALATAGAQDALQPRVRYVVHRGFVNERRKEGDGSQNLIQDDNKNDLISDKLVVTTDARSPKAHQLAEQPRVELAWWMAATQHQFRIVGKAYIYPSSSFPTHDGASSVADSSSSSKSDTKLSFPFPQKQLAPYEGFSWEDERIRQFRKLSPELRASFYRPVPGTKLADTDVKMEDLPEKLPEGVEEAEGEEQKKQVEQALKNFALIVIDAEEVDLVDLGSMPNTRTLWTCRDGSEWKEEDLVP
ncbi:hypothetical protein JCM10908_005401 [Rhodotorula pacifica]|uniref:uncharacterized protein n=1 Tax=Rhodotorula pacifica TaxID=1495444 RepID=UPI00318163B9